YLMDSRRDILQTDVEFIQQLNTQMNVILVFTKADQLNQKAKAALAKQLQTLGLSSQDYALVSRETPRLIAKLREQIQTYFPKPTATST
ncbi:MAG: hypothetical protein ACO3QN_04020, partial [Bacilli bacterium]